MITKTCPFCQKQFRARQSKSVYCSQRCQWDAKRLPPLLIVSKKCSICKQEKEATAFVKQQNTRTGFSSACKECINNSRKPSIIECPCQDCGITVLRKVHPWSKRSYVCPKCSIRRIMLKNGGKTVNYTGTDYYTGRTFAAWKSSAKRRDITWEVTKEYLDEQYKKQNGVCALSGIKMDIDNHSPYHISIDRIDSTKGYAEGNVQFVCAVVNMMKNKLTDECFIELCKKVALFRG